MIKQSNPEDAEMYLLVPAHQGCPGQSPESRKMVVLCVCKQSLKVIKALKFIIIGDRSIRQTYRLTVKMSYDKARILVSYYCHGEISSCSLMDLCMYVCNQLISNSTITYQVFCARV